ncbi:hypothetical protein CAPTEDRAFT_137412, partial [Capitella teleta]
FRFADKFDILLMVLGTVCATGHGICEPILYVIMGKLIDSFVYPNRNISQRNMDEIQLEMENEVLADMSSYAIYFTGIGIAVNVFAYGQVTCWLLTSCRQSQKLRVTLFNAVLRQEVGWFDTHEIGELNNRLNNDVNKVKEGIGDTIGNFWQWMTTFITGMILSFVYGWKLVSVAFAISPMLVIASGIMHNIVTKSVKKDLVACAKASAVASETLGAIKTVFAYAGQEKAYKRYFSLVKEARSSGIQKDLRVGICIGVNFFCVNTAYAISFLYGSQLIREDALYSLGIVCLICFTAQGASLALARAFEHIESWSTAQGAADHLWSIVHRQPLIDSTSKDGLKLEQIRGEIEFQDVYFKYPARSDVMVLKGFNMKARVGKTVALVGSSGCGKSTTVQMIQRFYDPEKGRILIDGIDIRKLNTEWLRSNIGVVSQEPVLFGTTIKENIRYGREGVTDDEIINATKQANAYDFIIKLPKGLETIVGERGAQLSGGQKQRIAIARALVRDPKILLLDEATSALDTEIESSVQAALDLARVSRTTIVIAHRLTTIRDADLIYGLKEGLVHESGSHDELIEKQGIYYQLAMNQVRMINFHQFEFMIWMSRWFSKKLVSRNEVPFLKKSLQMKKKKRYAHLACWTVHVNVMVQELPPVSVTRLLQLNSSEWFYVVMGCLGAILCGAIAPGFTVTLSEILKVYSLCIEDQEDVINIYIIAFFVIGFSSGLAMFVQHFFSALSGNGLTMKVRQLAFRAILRQEVAFFDHPQNNVGALSTRLSSDATAIQEATGTPFGIAFHSLSSLGAGLIIGFIYSWKLTLVTVGFIPVLVGGGILQMMVIQGTSRRQHTSEEAGRVTVEAIENIRTVASLTGERDFADEYERLTNKVNLDGMKAAHIIGLAFSLTMGSFYFVHAASFSFGAYLIQHNELTFPDMLKVIGPIVFGGTSLGHASHFTRGFGKGMKAAARLFALLDREPIIDSFSTKGKTPASDDCKGSVNFKDVVFSYPTRSTVPILRGFDLDVLEGKTVALVGSSGCGKSTSIQLMERFYDPAGGAVVNHPAQSSYLLIFYICQMIDGIDTRDLNISWLRSQIGIVSQEPLLFDSSIRENIAYGDSSRQVPMPEIIEAARNANIHTFIESLPEGYETNVGSKGTQLSGGQKQRVAIARALIRNPKILLLDEATSALDTESEKVVQEALDRAQEGRTSIVIAHRLSTIQNADLIVVIHNGRVAEQGSHAELIALRGIYHKLSNTQMK